MKQGDKVTIETGAPKKLRKRILYVEKVLTGGRVELCTERAWFSGALPDAGVWPTSALRKRRFSLGLEDDA